MLIELVDGGIKEIFTDTESWGGCSTCDYGSEYINEFEVQLTSGNIKVEVNNMYHYALSEDYLMKLFLQNIDAIRPMTEELFEKWLVQKLKEDVEKEVENLVIKCVFHDDYRGGMGW